MVNILKSSFGCFLPLVPALKVLVDLNPFFGSFNVKLFLDLELNSAFK